MSQFIVSILTIFGSGIVAAFVSYTLSSSKEHVFAMRQKAEDLYLNFIIYSDHVKKIHINQKYFFNGEADIIMLSNNINNIKSDRFAPEKIEMHIDIYFPELSAKFIEIKKLNIEIGSTMMKGAASVDNNGRFVENDPKSSIYNEFNNQVQLLSEKTNLFKNLITESAKSTASINALRPKLFVAIEKRIRETRGIHLE